MSENPVNSEQVLAHVRDAVEGEPEVTVPMLGHGYIRKRNIINALNKLGDMVSSGGATLLTGQGSSTKQPAGWRKLSDDELPGGSPTVSRGPDEHLEECDAVGWEKGYYYDEDGVPTTCVCATLEHQGRVAYVRGRRETLGDLGFQNVGTEDYMCPNCVTPWKCNGPHIGEPTWEGIETGVWDDAVGKVWESVAGMSELDEAQREAVLERITKQRRSPDS